MIADKDLKHVTRILEERRQALMKTSKGNQVELQSLRDQERDPEYEEGAQTEQADFTLSHLVEAERRELMLIDAARKRIEKGTYGECLDCGADIPLARLEALPYALRCEEDAERLEHERVGGHGALPSM